MNRGSLIAAALALAFAVSTGASAQSASERKAPAGAPAADNSAHNDPDRSGGKPTADEQSNSKADIELTQRIRRSVMDDKDLSVYAKNVKIVSSGGNVTLNGVVRSADEKKQIAAKAAAIAGDSRVRNELKIAPAD